MCEWRMCEWAIIKAIMNNAQRSVEEQGIMNKE